MSKSAKIEAEVKETVFGSKTERSVYYGLLDRWGKAYNIYLSLPVASVFVIKSGALSDGERKTYFQSSIDYTFCSKEDRPLFSIEFDGLGGGYSRGDRYITSESGIDKDIYRQLKLEFKLKIAKDAGYPLVIVSFQEVSALDKDEKLTILDGIIGQITSHKKFSELLSEFVKENHEAIESMSKHEIDEYLQDMVIGIEVDAELESDPIARKAAEYNQELSKFGVAGHSTEPLDEPEMPTIKSPYDTEGLGERITAFTNIRRYGYKVSVETSAGAISRSIWIREYMSSGFSSISLANNIAEYLTFKAALDKLKGKN